MRAGSARHGQVPALRGKRPALPGGARVLALVYRQQGRFGGCALQKRQLRIAVSYDHEGDPKLLCRESRKRQLRQNKRRHGAAHRTVRKRRCGQLHDQLRRELGAGEKWHTHNPGDQSQFHRAQANRRQRNVLNTRGLQHQPEQRVQVRAEVQIVRLERTAAPRHPCQRALLERALRREAWRREDEHRNHKLRHLVIRVGGHRGPVEPRRRVQCIRRAAFGRRVWWE